MASQIGIGIIGMGWMGMVHGRAYRQVRQRFPDSELIPDLVVCADDVAARCEEARDRLGFTRMTTDWREVMDDPEVSVVNITAPNRLHLDMVRAAAKAGNHVFCEKPVGRNPEETAEIARTAAEAGVLTWVGYNYRWAPLVQHTRSLVADGVLGDITHYRGRFFAGYANHPDGVLSWRFRREDAGSGALGDLMSHVADMAHMLAGPVRRVIGQQALFVEDRPVAPAGEGTHFSVGTGGEARTRDERRLRRGAGGVRKWRPGHLRSRPRDPGHPLPDGFRDPRYERRGAVGFRTHERIAVVHGRRPARRVRHPPERSGLSRSRALQPRSPPWASVTTTSKSWKRITFFVPSRWAGRASPASVKRRPWPRCWPRWNAPGRPTAGRRCRESAELPGAGHGLPFRPAPRYRRSKHGISPR